MLIFNNFYILQQIIKTRSGLKPTAKQSNYLLYILENNRDTVVFQNTEHAIPP